MNNEMIRLAALFLTRVKNFECDEHGKVDCDLKYKAMIMDDIGKVLAGGTDPEVLEGCIIKMSTESDKENFYKPSHLLTHYGITFQMKEYRDPDNLIQYGKFYFHPKLQVTPPPPKLTIHDNGDIFASYDEEPFYLEMVSKFTKKDVVDYFYFKKNTGDQSEAVFARDIGAVEHMLKFWDVDFILYLIDEAFVCSRDEGAQPIKNLLDIQRYEEEAQHVYANRKNTCFEGGLDRVIPRVRN